MKEILFCTSLLSCYSLRLICVVFHTGISFLWMKSIVSRRRFQHNSNDCRRKNERAGCLRAPRKERLPRNEFPEALKSNNFGRSAQQDSACPAKILLKRRKYEGGLFKLF